MRQLEDWRAEDEALEPGARQHPWLGFETFENLCAHVGGVSSPAALLDYLHHLGAVFYRPGLFHDRIILDQSWALDAVYALFERRNTYRQLIGSRGRFTRSLLAARCSSS